MKIKSILAASLLALGLGNSFAADPADFTFTTAAGPGTVAATFTGYDFDIQSITLDNVDISSLFGKTYTAPFTLPGGYNLPGIETWQLGATSVGSGAHTFGIYGTGTGTVLGGSTLTAQTLAVPEPETYAMLMAGLGVVGFMARRKKKAA